MKKYKTWEVIKMLEQNPSAEFKCQYNQKIGIKEGILRWDSGALFKINIEGYKDEDMRTAGTLDRFEWELIQQSVDFLTAVKAYSEGKTIRCELDQNSLKYNPLNAKENVVYGKPLVTNLFGSSIGCKEILEGRWYIEEV
jgi:hypothetical protein